MSLPLFPDLAATPRPRAPRRHLHPIERGEAGFAIPAGTGWALVRCGIHDAWQPVPAKDWQRGRAECGACQRHEPADPPAGHPRWTASSDSPPPWET